MPLKPPTKEDPVTVLEAGPLRIVRGYEVYHEGEGRIEFIGCVDGPLIKIQTPHTQLLFQVAFVDRLIEALQVQKAAPTAAPGSHDAELAAMGYRPVTR